jgi:multiple sugar transport system ATP-binding protein
MAQVILDKVDKVYPGDVTAVSGASLDIEDGEFVVLVGPSGCGKSTTLRMIAGLEEITRGTITIGDRIVNDVPPKDRDIAMVFQNYALYPHMTVRDNMAFGLKLRKFPRQEIMDRLDQAARMLNLEDLLDRKPKELSGGQRQRVAVGRAIVRQPAAFLFDEPLSNLDAKLRVQMRVEISRLHDELKTTMIYVTHDQVEAMTMGDRIVVMNAGVIQQVADPITLYDKPANMMVAGFIGMPPMNFFKGTLGNDQGVMTFTCNDFTLPVHASHDFLSERIESDIIIGIRPEHIGSTAAEHLPDAPRLTAHVTVVEPMGSESYIHLQRGDIRFISRVDAHRQIRVGDEMSPAVMHQHMHFFDPDTEVRLG